MINKKDGASVFNECVALARNSDCDKRKFGALIMSTALGRLDEAFGRGYNHKVSPILKSFDCCRLRASIPSGTRTEYCGAIHAEIMALQDALAVHSSVFGCILFIAGLNSDGSLFDNSKGFYCLPCAKELYHAGIKKLALASADTPKTGEWVYVAIEDALKTSLEFTKGTKTVSGEEDVLSAACKIVAGWSHSKRAAWEQRTGLKLSSKKQKTKERRN